MSKFKKAEAGQMIAYNAIKNGKIKFGTFKKTYFHIHTPESYDYYFLKSWGSEGLVNHSEMEIFNYCRDNKIILPTEVLEEMSLDKQYNTKKEMLAFLALAQSLINKSAEMVVVTDHNTILGFDKLYRAFELLKGFKSNIVTPKLIPGIEISCADKLHVVGIFERDENTFKLLNEWLEQNLIDIVSGSFKTSLDVLQFIENSLRGIGYIAHINSEDIFKEKSLNKAYKTKLFTDYSLKAIGVKNKDQIETAKESIFKYRDDEIAFVIDTDSHCVDDSEEQYFWIKSSILGFTSIKEALTDYDISIAFEISAISKQYIEGIYVTYSSEGFLSGKKSSEPFCLSFSNSLNCLIGGRGTGKSTVLELMEYILGQRYSSKSFLDFICKHGHSYILYVYEDDEYLIEMGMPCCKDEYESAYRTILSYGSRRLYGYHHETSEQRIKKTLISYYLNIFKIRNKDGLVQVEKISNKIELLKKFFDIRHSVNELVNSAKEEKIKEFIYETLFKNQVLSDPKNGIKFRKLSGLKNTILNIETIFSERENQVREIIDPFNASQCGTLKIVYKTNFGNTSPAFEDLLYGTEYRPTKGHKGFNIKERDVVEYLDAVFIKLGMFEFFKMVVDKDVTRALASVNIIDFCDPMTHRMVEDGIEKLDRKKVPHFLEDIFDDILNEKNVKLISDYLGDAVFDAESFSLKFNINNKENATGKPIFRSVDELSLGQKVVAMLSFILGYSEYSKDYRPLLLDQPEDNLDNQYIYKNLVAELRKVKEKRQVIIATHNATIVTNAKADQVCVMESDNEHGWISIAGYPGERKIKEKIINYLEGGKESFKHKISIYEEVLK